MHSRKEADVGMTEYISTQTGFHGIIKMRYQDFLVNEIDEDGNIVHLTDLTCKNMTGASDDDNTLEVQNTDVLSAEDKESIDSVVRGEETEAVLKAGESKQTRTQIHKAINFIYPELESKTTDDAETEEKVIKVTKKAQNSGLKRGSRNTRMPKKSLCKFVLFKQNIGTMEGINSIAKRLRLHKANGFQYAGTKDKRAVTSQLVTAPLAAERLCGLNKSSSNMKLGNFSYCKKPLQLGSLQGNHFSMVVRDVRVSDEQVKIAFKSFSETGFINYYGSQRFGTTSVPTYSVGIEILKSNWQKVIELLLRPREGDQKHAELNEGLNEYAKSGDADSALKCLRFKGSIEGILLKGLCRYGKTQLVQAITTIPRNMRKMYVHSYQSYVWNRIASRRIKELGLEPVAGDLVDINTYQDKVTNTSQEGDTEEGGEEPPRKRTRPSGVERENPVAGSETAKNPQGVRSLSEEEAGLFSISDVLLPLPGHDVTYPKNVVGTWYKETMSGDGVDIDTHMVHKQKDYSLPGDYRNIVVRPTRVEFDTVQYDDYTVPLLLTDLEKLEGREPPSSVPGGKYKALRVQFSLPSSSYATVALREILKVDVSVAAQMELNKQHGPAEDVVIEEERNAHLVQKTT